MRKLILLSFAFVLFIAAHAQMDYSTGIGVRLGLNSGLTVKHFVSDQAAFEGLLAARWRGFTLTGLYEWHMNAFETTNFNFYYGAGGHVGWWENYNYNHPWFPDDGRYITIGIDGLIGLEYSFDEVPFSISLDWKPFLDIVTHTGFIADDLALSVRYTIQ